MRVAVVGGGLFGCTAAAFAARAGHEVHLLEARGRLMGGATSACYYRLHRGYHYPRSPETGLESLAAEASFREEYGECVVDGGRQFYAIPPDAKVTPVEFLKFMHRMRLPFDAADDCGLVEGCKVYRVGEPRIDAMMLAVLARRHAMEAGVHVHLGSEVTDALTGFDQVIVAAYAGTNRALKALGLPPTEYKFQVVEKPIARLGPDFVGASVVVMDVCCVDPHQATDAHALGHVSETIHAENVGTEPEIPEHIRPHLECGVIRHWEAPSHVTEVSRIQGVVESIGAYIPAARSVEYTGSMYSVRAVLAGQEATDARPSLVTRLDDRVIRIFSGKLGTAVEAAKRTVAMLEQQMVAA
jgi:hypothetical protein